MAAKGQPSGALGGDELPPYTIEPVCIEVHCFGWKASIARGRRCCASWYRAGSGPR